MPRSGTRPDPPHRTLGSPPRHSRALRQRRARGCRAPAARWTAAAPSASTRLGSAPRRSSSSTALRSGGQSGPPPSPPAPARPPRSRPHCSSSSCSAARSRQASSAAAPMPALSPSLTVSNFPRRPCAHAPPRPWALGSVPGCPVGYPARLPRVAPAWHTWGFKLQCPPRSATSSGAQVEPGGCTIFWSQNGETRTQLAEGGGATTR